MYYTAAGHKEHIDSIALDIEQFVEELAEAALLNGFIFVRIHFLLLLLCGLYFFICTIIAHIFCYFKKNCQILHKFVLYRTPFIIWKNQADNLVTVENSELLKTILYWDFGADFILDLFREFGKIESRMVV